MAWITFDCDEGQHAGCEGVVNRDSSWEMSCGCTCHHPPSPKEEVPK